MIFVASVHSTMTGLSSISACKVTKFLTFQNCTSDWFIINWFTKNSKFNSYLIFCFLPLVLSYLCCWFWFSRILLSLSSSSSIIERVVLLVAFYDDGHHGFNEACEMRYRHCRTQNNDYLCTHTCRLCQMLIEDLHNCPVISWWNEKNLKFWQIFMHHAIASCVYLFDV